jgi:hypothetical protein
MSLRTRRGTLGILLIGLLLGGLLVSLIPGVSAVVGQPLIMGERNTSGTSQTKIWAVANQSALKITNKLSGHPALWLEVRDDTTPPLRVSSPALVDNLNVDMVDGMDADEFVHAGKTCPPGVTLSGFDALGEPICVGEAISVLDPYESGQHASLVLDAAGNPVIAYVRYVHPDYSLLLMHCNDLACTGGDESVEVVSTADDFYDTSLELDAAGNPVIAYRDPAIGLRLAHCNDPNCAGTDDSIETADAGPSLGLHASLALDGAGYPVIASWDFPNKALKVVHCNDVNCAGGDESVETVDGAVDEVGSYCSLALDALGYPVISYYNDTSDDLILTHCNDPNCSGANESIKTVDADGNVGQWTSLVLDGSGNPVIAYYDGTTHDLKLAHCDDPDCSGDNESITFVDRLGQTGQFTSMTLDASGYPVIAYQQVTDRDLRLAICNDPDCTGGDEALHIVDGNGDQGQHSDVALDAAGRPVIVHYDSANHALKLAIVYG